MKKSLIALAILFGYPVVWALGHGMGYNTALEYHQIDTSAQVAQIPTYTGYDLFQAINAYRAEQGVAPLIMDESLCNNIAQRWIYYREYINGETNIAHQDFEAFIRENIFTTTDVTEILATGDTADESVQGWAGSPSHNIPLLARTHGCTYASEGAAVALLSSYRW